MGFDFFDGFPYQVTRVAPSLYNLLVLPSELPLSHLKNIVRWQAWANKMPAGLVLGPERCVYFELDEAEAAACVIPHGGMQVTGFLHPCYRLPVSGDTLEWLESLAEWVEARGFAGTFMGNVTKGGRLATEEELVTLAGCDEHGRPKGLSQCPVCGDFRGECLDPDPRFEGLVMPVYCRCENDTLCACCARPLAERRVNGNFFRCGIVCHVPGFAAFRHQCQGAESQETVDLGPRGRRFRAFVLGKTISQEGCEMRAGLYARVSTADQTCDLQLRELREYVARRGWQVAGEYVDSGWSGVKADRPELNRLMADARRRKFDVVAVWRFDRFARSAKQLVLAMPAFFSSVVGHQNAVFEQNQSVEVTRRARVAVPIMNRWFRSSSQCSPTSAPSF